MGTVRADDPRLDARDVDAARQPRRLAFGSGPLPDGSPLELRSGTLVDELAALAAEGVQSLLLEGGPTLATGFLEQDSSTSSSSSSLLVSPGQARRSRRPAAADAACRGHDVQRVGDDVLVSAYVHEP